MIWKMKYLVFFISLLVVFSSYAATNLVEQKHIPTIDDLLMIKTINGAQISPDGKWIAYLINETNFKQDSFVTQIWLANVTTGRIFQLTRSEKSASNIQWSSDGAWIAFISDRVGDKNQIFIISPEGGEEIQLTKSESGINNYAWSEDGKNIAFTASESLSQALKDRKEIFGDFQIVRKDYTFNQLWTFDLAEALKEPVTGKQRIKTKDFNINSFAWSPDGNRIAFSATLNPDLINSQTSDIYLLNLSDDSTKKIVSLPGSDTSPNWSPEGKQIIFTSTMGKNDFVASNTRLAVISVEGGTPRSITDDFDENPGFVAWTKEGVYFYGLQKTTSHLFLVNPQSGVIKRITNPENLMAVSFSLTRNGEKMAFTAGSPNSLSELFTSDVKSFAPRKLTLMTEQVKDFIMGTREVISWKSKDGTPIEGVLIKPVDFDSNRKYPLLTIIHGGPTDIARPALSSDVRYYPADIWAARGALVLKVNYRGSAGYGEKFRTLNFRNLGIGDSWDVVSGIDYLISKGWVDDKKVGCMGWSQGGYISAFLATFTDRCKAVSVGAGISNWNTYYYNTDVTQFTTNYLGATPINDSEIYRKTSPMSYIENAKTPALIQHGELDRRVPIANAYELRQALEDRKIQVKMIVYKGAGHQITKPKSMRAVMQHNLEWFNHFIWEDSLTDFTNPNSLKGS